MTGEVFKEIVTSKLQNTEVTSPSSFKMANPSPTKMASATCSPAKKRRVDNLTDLITSTGDYLDMLITSTIIWGERMRLKLHGYLKKSGG